MLFFLATQTVAMLVVPVIATHPSRVDTPKAQARAMRKGLAKSTAKVLVTPRVQAKDTRRAQEELKGLARPSSMDHGPPPKLSTLISLTLDHPPTEEVLPTPSLETTMTTLKVSARLPL